MRRFRSIMAGGAAAALVLAGTSAAIADNINNDIVTADKTMALTMGGSAGITRLSVKPTNDDEKNGCNLTGHTSVVVKVVSSDPAVATADPTSLTFGSCGDTKRLTVTPLAQGSTTISLEEVSNTSQGAFNLRPATFTVNVSAATAAKSPTSVNLWCPDSVVYSGLPEEPCEATVVGDDLPANAEATLAYTNNIDAGMAWVTATYPGDDTHESSWDERSFEITKAPSEVTITCDDPVWFTGGPIEPCSARVTGAGGLDEPVAVTYTNNTMPGTATATASYGGDDNHEPSGVETEHFTINGYDLDGFYKPVDMAKTNIVKAGSTVPLKFQVFLNDVEQTDTAVVEGITMTQVDCKTGKAKGGAEDIGNTGGTSLRYDVKAGQFTQNWQTPKSGACYTVTMTTIDGGSFSAGFQLK